MHLPKVKARAIQQQTVKTIRLGSSLLNPGNLLIDLWNQVSPDPSEYRIKMVPYSDDRQKILSVVSSLGEEIDFMVGVFGSRQMLSLSNFLNWAASPYPLLFPGITALLLKKYWKSRICTENGFSLSKRATPSI